MKMMQILKNKKGFTLMELIVVLIIIAILMAALTPTLIGWINDARESSLRSEGRTVLLAIQTVSTEAKGKGVWGDGTNYVGVNTTRVNADPRFVQIMTEAGFRTGAKYNPTFAPGTSTTNTAVTGIWLDSAGNVVGIRIRNTVGTGRNSDNEGAGYLRVGNIGSSITLSP